MKPRKLRRSVALASSLCAAATATVLMMGAALAVPASAAITPPAFPTFGTYPEFLPANGQVSNIDHSEGSDTTLFVMQSISDLYSQAGIFPFSCQLNSNNQTCETPAQLGSNPDNTQSDTVDNFAGTEELQGVNNVGSTNGQGELCGSAGKPVEGTVDYARSSKPPGGVSGCTDTLQGFGYAKDGVTAVDFQAIDPNLYGSSPTGYSGTSFISYDYTSGSTINTTFPSGSIGDVADGWLPGDPYTCGYNGGAACSGVPFTDVDNNFAGAAGQDGGPNRLGSDVFRLWCQHGSSGTAGLSQIMDWGNLTNLGPNLEVLNVTLNGTTTATLASGENFPSTVASGQTITGPDITAGTHVTAVSGGTLTLSQAAGSGTDTVHITTSSVLLPGQGMPIGVPIRIIAVNLGSGTASTFNNFAKSGAASGTNCANGPTNGVGGNFNENAAQGANPQTSQSQTGPEVALENDANQIGDFALSNWGSTDTADQAIDIATSLYYMGNGAFLQNPNASISSLTGTVPSGAPTSFQETQLDANLVGGVGIAGERNNSWPMARTLFNVVDTTAGVRASVGGFLNWMCDGGSSATINGSAVSPLTPKGTDHIDGGNFDTDLTTLINSTYHYSRLTDTTPELAAGSQVAADTVTNLNGTCEATQPIASITAGNTTVNVTGASSTIKVGWPVYVPSGYTLTIPSGTTVAAVGANSITLSVAPTSTGSGTSTPSTLYFPGHPPVLSVSDPNS